MWMENTQIGLLFGGNIWGPAYRFGGGETRIKLSVCHSSCIDKASGARSPGGGGSRSGGGGWVRGVRGERVRGGKIHESVVFRCAEAMNWSLEKCAQATNWLLGENAEGMNGLSRKYTETIDWLSGKYADAMNWLLGKYTERGWNRDRGERGNPC